MEIVQRMERVVMALVPTGEAFLLMDVKIAAINGGHIVLLTPEAYASAVIQSAMHAEFPSGLETSTVAWAPMEDATEKDKSVALLKFKMTLDMSLPGLEPLSLRELEGAGVGIMFKDTPVSRRAIREAMKAFELPQGTSSLIVLLKGESSVYVMSHTSSPKVKEAKPMERIRDSITMDELQDPARTRERSISRSDIQDISILVNTATTLEELLQGMETIGVQDGY